jgi:hypothetical protein
MSPTPARVSGFISWWRMWTPSTGLVANGVDVDGPPEQRPWGMREFHATDLNGYRFVFGKSTE